MTSEYVFHIRNANPDDMVATLMILEEQPALETVSAIVDYADSIGLPIRDRQRLEALMTARDLGLVEQNTNALTQLGHLLLKTEVYKPDIFSDVIHGLQYMCWKPQSASNHCFSWSYRAICQMLWSAGSLEIDNRRDLASKIENQARETFKRSDITFSPKSIGGAFLWIETLKPKVIDEYTNYFARRTFCPPELFILAIDFVYQENSVDYGVNLLLNNANKDAVCKMCLLETPAFDRVLEYAIDQFDYLQTGVGGGWGQYIALNQQPKLEDFI